MKKKILYIEENEYVSETFIKHEKFKIVDKYNVESMSIIDIKFNLISIIKNIVDFRQRKIIVLCIKLLFSSLNHFASLKSNSKIVFLFLSLDFKELKYRYSDVIHIRSHFIAKRSYFALFLAELLNITFSSVAHADDIFYWHKSKELIFKKSAYVHCISNYNIGFINAKTRFKFSDKLKLIYNSFNSEIPVFNSTEIKQDNKVQFLFIGRIIEKKGLLEFLKLFMKMDIPNSYFTIIGDGPFKIKLEEFVNQNQLDDRVVFKGVLNNSDSIKLLVGSDFLVITSLNANPNSYSMDGIPTVVFESLSNGVPVITTQVSGIPEFLYDNKNGIIINNIITETSEDLKNKIIKFDTSKEKIIELFNLKYQGRMGGTSFLNELDKLC